MKDWLKDKLKEAWAHASGFQESTEEAQITTSVVFCHSHFLLVFRTAGRTEIYIQKFPKLLSNTN